MRGAAVVRTKGDRTPMDGTQHALDFLDRGVKSVPGLVALFGDEAFLRRLARARLRSMVLGDDPETPHTTLDGAAAAWCDVADELATVSLFGAGRRLVVVQGADSFVTKFRNQLEDYVARARHSGVLVLEVGTWASNTRLYKALDQKGLQIECRLPQKSVGRSTELDERRLGQWLTARSRQVHQAQLDVRAAVLLWERAGPDLGVVDQELAKLVLFAGPQGKITAQLVEDVVGGWRAKTIWEVVEAAAKGDAAEALRHLDLALQSGEHAQALFGQIAWSLRRFAVATRIYQSAKRRGETVSLREALVQAGFRVWPAKVLPEAEEQLRQLGSDRAGRLLSWLLETDLALKGTHSSSDRARFALELLFLRLAKRSAPQGGVTRPSAMDR
jgi:DNA polymerase-3 subunit delta